MKSQKIQRKHSSIPSDPCPDSTLKLLSEGYLYIPNRIRRYNTELFQTRLMGQKIICFSGKTAAEKFYDQNLFTRKNAVPKRIQETLFGKKAIQTLDSTEHSDRKLMFMSLMSPERINQIIDLTKRQWQMNTKNWNLRNHVVLFKEAEKLFFQVACRWAGVPLKKTEVIQKAKDMSAMIDAFGTVGFRHKKGRCARNRCECWAKELIMDVRTRRTIVPADSALYIIAEHRNPTGERMEPSVAAVELINILRPITAIATYVTFGALALHTYPMYRKQLTSEDDNYLTMFAQEVRRYYPFGPFLGAKVRNEFQWQNHRFKKGDLVFLDIYGTNHDPKVWRFPNEFLPEHFEGRVNNPFDFIPQGGGDSVTGTRCPGEGLTIELLKVSMNFLVNQLEYSVPLQDLSYRLNRIPAIPKSRFIMSNIRRKS